MDTIQSRPAGYSWEQAEFDLTGELLKWPEEVIGPVRRIVSARDFSNPTARAIFTAACQLDNLHQPMDVVLIQAQAERNGETLDQEKIAEILLTAITPTNAEETAKVIREGAVLRESQEIATELQMGRMDRQEAGRKLLDLEMGGHLQLPGPVDSVNDFFDELDMIYNGEKRLFMKTGYPSLNRQLGGGLIRSGMITLAARPGVGKTTMALALADSVAATGAYVLYESLEMSRFQLMCRRFARETGLDFTAIQNGELEKKDWAKLTDAAPTLSGRRFIIQDRPSTMDEIERRAVAEKPDLLVIDHIGLVSTGKAGGGKRYEEMTEISHRVKRLAMTLDKPVLALCQLNRQSASRKDNRPMLTDLRDTGAIEEDSDAVLLLHRPDMTAPEEEKALPWEMQDMEVAVEKNRHGPTGIVRFGFIGMSAKVLEMQQERPKTKGNYK